MPELVGKLLSRYPTPALLRHLLREVVGENAVSELPGDPVEPIVLADRVVQVARAYGREALLITKLQERDEFIAQTASWEKANPRFLGSKYAFFAEACAQLADTQSFRGTFFGPVFLFPEWIVARRDLQRQTPNFSVAVRRFLDAMNASGRFSARVILRNTPAFLEDYDRLVKRTERARFIRDMLLEVTELLGLAGDRGPQLRCIDTGYIYLPLIFDHAVLVTTRADPMAPVDSGWIETSPEVVQREKDRFDKVFDGVQHDQASAIRALQAYIRCFWKA